MDEFPKAGVSPCRAYTEIETEIYYRETAAKLDRYQEGREKEVKKMRAIYVGVIATVIGYLWATGMATAQQEITGGDVRAIIDGKYALTSEGYAAYRKCISATPLGGELEKYTAALEKCKETTKEDAFALPDSTNLIQNESPSPSTDRAWQTERLQKLQ